MDNLINLAADEGIKLEIFENKEERTDISINNTDLKLFQVVNASAYDIKAIKNGKCLIFTTDSITNTKKIIEDINTMFLLQDNINENRLCSNNIENKLRNIDELDYNKIKKDLFSLNDLKKDYPSIINIEASFSHYNKGYYLKNENAKMIDEAYFNEVDVVITIKKDTVTRVLYTSLYLKDYDFEEIKKYITSKIDTFLIKLNSDSVKTNKYNIILTNDVVANILTAFIDSFDTKSIYLKESVLENKFNTQIFSDKISIIEDPNNEDAVFRRCFDIEGTLTTYKKIVEKGKFVKKINDLEYAIKTNEEATGNASGVNNLYIKPGKKSYLDLVKKLDNGIIIDEVYGTHSGIDTKSGNISLQAEGFYVENGKIVKGLNMIILSTNFFELFTNVIEVGNDLSKSLLSVRCPSLLLENITISGKE